MPVKLLTSEAVRGYSHSKLVGDFEVLCANLFDKATPQDRETKTKNLNTLRTEIYARMTPLRVIK